MGIMETIKELNNQLVITHEEYIAEIKKITSYISMYGSEIVSGTLFEEADKLAKEIDQLKKLIKEKTGVDYSGKVITKMWLHGSKEDSFDVGRKLGLSEKALKVFVNALYEIEFEVEVELLSGESQIVAVNGKKLME
jgi:hypothetical protein